MQEERYGSSHHTPLGHHLFPGDDFFSQHAQNCFSEFLGSQQKDVLASYDTFITNFETFIPEDVKVKMEQKDWTSGSIHKLWMSTRALIISAVKVKFNVT